MTLESDLFEALRGLVADRVYRSKFPQGPGAPVWPAIRFTRVSGTPTPDICGTGDEDTDDVEYQIDIVAQTPAEVDALAAQVIQAMKAYPHPNARIGRRDDPFDPTTNTERTSLDFVVNLSSP